jgi:hypothetical protein
VEGYYEMVLSFLSFSPMRPRIGEEKVKESSSINYLYTQNKDVIYNPINPVNPDSRLRLKAHLKSKTTYRQKQQ